MGWGKVTCSKKRTVRRLRGSTASGGQGAPAGQTSGSWRLEVPLSPCRSGRGRGRDTTTTGDEALVQADREVMRQDHQRHVVIPPAPEAQVVVGHPQRALALRKAALNRPAHAADTEELGDRCVGGRIREVVLEL